MKIAILSRQPRSYSTKRLREAAVARGHQAQVLNTLKFGIEVEETGPDLYYMGRRVQKFDAVIPRIGTSITFFGTAVVRQFEQMGIQTLNSALGISTSRDKLRSMQILSRHVIGIPKTAFVKDRADVLPAIQRVGGAPVIIKLLEGTQGIGVILADSPKIAEAIIETLHSTKQNVLIQKFVAESKGTDVRAFVVGDRVVAAMRRRAQGGEFRSNVHRGGKTEVLELDEHYTNTAIKAAQIMGLHVAGVDMLEGGDGPKVMEVNSSPGLEGIETATGLDIASMIIEHLEERALLKEVDIRQRLTLTKGYRIVEIGVHADSEIAHKLLSEVPLKERDILVLSIERQGLIIPNPRGSREILPGDVLLCYGKRQALEAIAEGKV